MKTKLTFGGTNFGKHTRLNSQHIFPQIVGKILPKSPSKCSQITLTIQLCDHFHQSELTVSCSKIIFSQGQCVIFVKKQDTK